MMRKLVSDGTGATNDSITVTSATCTFRFGSINLGSGAYVSGNNATFAGNTGATRSTIAWSASTRTLTITLGAMTAGTVATVATSTPIYTASGSVLDSAGGEGELGAALLEAGDARAVGPFEPFLLGCARHGGQPPPGDARALGSVKRVTSRG